MNTNYFIHETINGQKYLNVQNSWDAQAETLIKEQKIDYLWLSSGDWGDFAFLKTIKENIKILRLTTDCPDLQGLHTLSNLEDLTLDVVTKSFLDFSMFPKLKRCHIFWNPNFSFNLFELKALEFLSIRYFGGNSFQPFSNLENLLELEIMESKLFTLDGVAKLQKLQNLVLYNLKKLSNIDELSYLQDLKLLSLNNCQNIGSLRCLSSLVSLETLHLASMGQLDSLYFLTFLTQLECFNFSGSTNINDGNLTLLTELPKLKLVGFQNRKHYTHKFKELQKILDARVIVAS